MGELERIVSSMNVNLSTPKIKMLFSNNYDNIKALNNDL